MGDNELTQKLIEMLLSWIRLVTGWVWNFFQADMAGGFLVWFADNWAGIALTMIVVGLVIDWLIWMIRWRPYWLWLRKRQIIYEEVEIPGRKRGAAPRPVRHMPSTAASDDDDPFAAGQVDPYAARNTARRPGGQDESADWEAVWEADDDPYAGQAASGAKTRS